MTSTNTDEGYICLYFGNPEECQNCGGWVKAEGGPFPGDSRYCSEDCFADAQERAAQRDARLAWCEDCGYDQGEHDSECKQTSLTEQFLSALASHDGHVIT